MYSTQKVKLVIIDQLSYFQVTVARNLTLRTKIVSCQFIFWHSAPNGAAIVDNYTHNERCLV